MTSPIRVTTMIDSLLAGGAERVAVELACALDRTRFTPHVLVTRGDGPLRDLLERADVPFTMLERESSLDVRAWRRAHRHLVEHADVLHAHKFGSNAWGALLSRTSRTPLVVHEHNFSQVASRSRSFISRRWIATRARRVLCVSDSVADIERAGGVPERLLQVVPNGVRLDGAWPRQQARTALGISDESFTIGIVGRLREEKAHEVLLDAVARLATQGRDVHLCIVGDGPREQELRALVATLDIESRVTWAGERRDAATLAGAFDAAVICSHWEGLPLAALEAMAAGTPLVASSVGGLPTLLADGAGLLAPPGDPAAFAAALTQLVDDPERARRLGAAGRARIAERYSFDAMVDTVQQIYAEASGQQPSRLDDTTTRTHGREEHAA